MAQVYADGRVVVLLQRYDSLNLDVHVVASDATTGEPAWNVTLTSDTETYDDRGRDYARALAASPDGRTIYAIMWMDNYETDDFGSLPDPTRTEGSVMRIVALNASTGAQAWQSDTPRFVPWDLDEVVVDLRIRAVPYAALVSEDGSRLLVAGREAPGTVRILGFNTQTGLLQWHQSVSSPATPALAVLGMTAYLLAGNQTLAYDAKEGTPLWAASLAVSANALAVRGERVYASGGLPYAFTDGQWQREWVLTALDATTGAQAWVTRHLAPVWAPQEAVLAIAPDGEHIVSAASSSQGPRVLSVDRDGHLEWTRTLAGAGWQKPALLVASHEAWVISTGASTSANATSLDLATGNDLWTREEWFPGSVSVVAAGLSGGLTVSMSLKTSLGTASLTYAMDPSTGEQHWTRVEAYEGHYRDNAVKALLSPDGSTVYSVGASRTDGMAFADDYVLIAHDAQTGERKYASHHQHRTSHGSRTSALISSASISQDGSVVYVVGTEQTMGPIRSSAIAAFRASDGALAWSALIPAAGADVDALPTGALVTAAGPEWTQTTLFAYDDEGNLTWTRVIDNALTYQRRAITTVSPDGSRAYIALPWPDLSTDNNGAQLRLIAFDTTSGETAWEATMPNSKDAYASATTLSPDGQRIVVAGTFGGLGEAGAAFDAQTGQHLWTAKGIQNRTYARDVAVSPDGSRVAFPYDSGLAVYSMSTGALLWRHSGIGSGTTWTPDGETVLLTGASSTSSPAARTSALEAATGTLRWARDYPAAEGRSVVATESRAFVAGYTTSRYVGYYSGPFLGEEALTLAYDL